MIAKIKKNLRYKKFGVSCMFVPVTKCTGIKLYKSAKERDYAYTLQKKAYLKGVAPKVYKKHNLRKSLYHFNYHLVKYGYITQRCTKVENASTKDFLKLTSKMQKLGFKTTDINCYHNVGYIKKKLVCIDFDKASHG